VVVVVVVVITGGGGGVVVVTCSDVTVRVTGVGAHPACAARQAASTAPVNKPRRNLASLIGTSIALAIALGDDPIARHDGSTARLSNTGI
jgi:hypothetical protein